MSLLLHAVLLHIYCPHQLSCNDSCPSQLQSLAEDLQLAGVEGQTDGKLCYSGEGGTNVMISLYIHVCVAPPMIVGVWSMAVVLWQLLEYYYIITSGMLHIVDEWESVYAKLEAHLKLRYVQCPSQIQIYRKIT